EFPDGRTLAQGDTYRSANSDAPPRPGRTPYTRPEARVLENAGYAVAKANHGDRPFMLTMLCTSASITHKLEDDLSLALFFDGVEWIADPSFYSHEYTTELPAYLRSAEAHSVVFLEGRSFSIEPGTCSLRSIPTSEGFCFEGETRAYTGIQLRRKIRGSLSHLGLSVSEHITSTERCEAVLNIQCGDGVIVDTARDGIELSHPHSKYRILI